MESLQVLATTAGYCVASSVSTMADPEASFREPPPASFTTAPMFQSLALRIMLVIFLLSPLLFYVIPRLRQMLLRRSAARLRAESMAKLEKQSRNTKIHVQNSIQAVNRFVADGRIEHARRHFVSNVENTTKKWNRTREKVLTTFHVKFPGEPIPDFLATESPVPDFPSPPRGSLSEANSPTSGSPSRRTSPRRSPQVISMPDLAASTSVQPGLNTMPPILPQKTTPSIPSLSLDTPSSATDTPLPTPSFTTTSASIYADRSAFPPNVARVKQRVASAGGQVIEKDTTVEVLKKGSQGSRLVKVIITGQLLTLPSACLEMASDPETFHAAYESSSFGDSFPTVIESHQQQPDAVETRPGNPTSGAKGLLSEANASHPQPADSVQARPESTTSEARGSLSEANASRKRPNEDLGLGLYENGQLKRAKSSSLGILSTETIIARAKNRGRHYYEPKLLLRCVECTVLQRRTCDKESPSDPCTWCKTQNVLCVCLPRMTAPLNACDRCYGDTQMHSGCKQGEGTADCKRCVTHHLECTWVVRDYSYRRRTELIDERSMWRKRVLSRVNGHNASDDDSPLAAPPSHPKGKRKAASGTDQSGVLSDATDDYQPKDDTRPKHKRKKAESPAQSATVPDHNRRSSTRRRATQNCPHSTEAKCVKDRIKQVSEESELYAKYMQLCQAATEAGDLCVPGSVISNFGVPLACLIQRDSGPTEDNFAGLWLTLPHCKDHEAPSRLSEDHERVSFPVAAALLEQERQFGEASSLKAVDQYVEHTTAVPPIGKICHQKTCVQHSHITWKFLTCHRRAAMEELRHSARPAIPKTCGKGCLPRQAVKTSKQTIIEAFCLINHIKDPFDSALWTDEMIGKGVQSDAPGFFSSSINRDDFIMLIFTTRNRAVEKPLTHIINKISLLNATTRRDVSSETVDDQYALFQLSYFPETPLFSLKELDDEDSPDIEDGGLSGDDDAAPDGSQVLGEDIHVFSEDGVSDAYEE